MPEYTNNILLTGYWPPTNNMLRGFSIRPEQNPMGYRGRNWRGHGFNVYAFFPEFDIPDEDVGDGSHPYERADVGSGYLRVDYQDTKEDWDWITRWLRPCAIITFSRGSRGSNSWILEEEVRNWERDMWSDDMKKPYKPTRDPPDSSRPANTTRHSTLPMEAISERVNSASHLDVFSRVSSSGAGDFLSNFIGYLGVWYQADHASRDADGMCFAAGHVHVGGNVSDPDAAEATEITLEALLDHIKPMRPTTWISEIMFRVQTKDSVNAGTDDLLTVEFFRDGEHLETGELNFDHINDHERGDSRYYNFVLPRLYFDETRPLPFWARDISPKPYPKRGMEFSNGVAGNLGCRIRIHGDDMWIKDQVDIYVKEVRPPSAFGATAWVEDDTHRKLGSWSKDVSLSTYSDEGYEYWPILY